MDHPDLGSNLHPYAGRMPALGPRGGDQRWYHGRSHIASPNKLTYPTNCNEGTSACDLHTNNE